MLQLKCSSFHFKACARYFSLFLKDIISSLFWTKYIEKKFNFQLFFLPTALHTFILSRATMRYLPPWNVLFRKNNCVCNRDNAYDVAAWVRWIKHKEKWTKQTKYKPRWTPWKVFKLWAHVIEYQIEWDIF